MATSQSPQPAAKVSAWEDFVDIFASPSEVFTRRMGTNPVVWIIVLSLLSGALYFAIKGVLQPGLDADFARMTAKIMAKNPQITAEQMQAGRRFERFGAFLVPVVSAIVIALTGLTLWLVGKIFGSKQTAGDGIMVATYAYIPRLLGLVAVGAVALLTEPSHMVSMFSPTLSVARFLNPDTASPVAFQLAGRLDVFVLWQTVLLAVGLSVTGKVSRAQAFAAAAMLWLVGSLPQLVGALRQ